MEVYVERTYATNEEKGKDAKEEFPFWDYRSRRSQKPSLSSSSAEDGNKTLAATMGWPGDPSQGQGDTVTSKLDPARVTLHIIADTHEICPLLDLYNPIVHHVDPNLNLFRVTEQTIATSRNSLSSPLPSNPSINSITSTGSDVTSASLPSLTVMIFLKSPDQINTNDVCNSSDPDSEQKPDRFELAQSLLKKPPWKFHHHERLTVGKINTIPSNRPEFFYTSSDLPLWAIRHVHYGKEHVRFVLYTSDSAWSDQVQFYKLILGLEPDLLRDDFCLFTTHEGEDYDVQFALKKVDEDVQVTTLNCVHIQVKVKDIGLLVPLFPHICRPISDVIWQTTDHEGNTVVLDVINPMPSSSSSSSLSSLSLSPVSSSRSNLSSRQQHTQSLIQEGRTHESVFVRCQSSPTTFVERSSVTLLNDELYEQRVKTSLRSPLSHHNAAFPKQDNSYPNLNKHYLYSGNVYENSNFCDDAGSNDPDLNNPVTSTRINVTPEEDEESLTLTNTSEESGIQVQMGSVDLSFGDDEPLLKSCLSWSKSSSISKDRTGKSLKVTFNEHVEEFEDDVFSRMSSGIESEDQSEEEEMVTSFRHTPNVSPENAKVKSNSSLVLRPRGDVSIIRATTGSDYVTMTLPNRQRKNGASDSISEPVMNSTSNVSVKDLSVSGGYTQRSLAENETSLDLTSCSNSKDDAICSSPRARAVNSNVVPDICDKNNAIKTCQEQTGCNRPLQPPSYTESCGTLGRSLSPRTRPPAPPSYESVQAKRQASGLAPPFTGLISPFCINNQSQKSSLPSSEECENVNKESKLVNNNKSSKDQNNQTLSRKSIEPRVTQDIKSLRRQSLIDQSPTKSSTKWQTSPAQPCRPSSTPPTQSQSPTTMTARPPPPPPPKRTHSLNQCSESAKRFEPSDKEDKDNVSSSQEDLRLTFTLKFDTCPTSGLSSREEQIGFYV